MTRKEKQIIIKETELLSDDELKKLYYESVFDSLGSQVEDMFELGYDMIDVKERVNYERFLIEKSTILETICIARGIKLWNEEEQNEQEN